MQKSFLRIFFQFRNTVPFQRFPKSAYGYGHIQVPGDCKHVFHLSGLFPQLFQHPVKLKDIQMQYHPQIIRKDIQRISTNLSLTQLRDSYTDRVTSRIMRYRIIPLYGRDIRLLKR